MEHAIASFKIGDRVRYVGRTVMPWPTGTEGEVVEWPHKPSTRMVAVDFGDGSLVACWPAELERVDLCPICGEEHDMITRADCPQWEGHQAQVPSHEAEARDYAREQWEG